MNRRQSKCGSLILQFAVKFKLIIVVLNCVLFLGKGILKFNVTQFTEYSAEETSIPTPAPTGAAVSKKPYAVTIIEEKPAEVKPTLFDVKINVINKFKQVIQGENVIAEIELIKITDQ